MFNIKPAAVPHVPPLQVMPNTSLYITPKPKSILDAENCPGPPSVKSVMFSANDPVAVSPGVPSGPRPTPICQLLVPSSNLALSKGAYRMSAYKIKRRCKGQDIRRLRSVPQWPQDRTSPRRVRCAPCLPPHKLMYATTACRITYPQSRCPDTQI